MTAISIGAFLANYRVGAALIDHSGVLSMKTILPNVDQTINWFRNHGIPTVLVTNNSFSSISTIQNALIDNRITMDIIISSGMGLTQDPEIITRLTVPFYLQGGPTSPEYLPDNYVLSDAPNSNTIILAGNNRDTTWISEVIDTVRKRPRPIICVNPDRIIRRPSGIVPVIGTDAAHIELETGVPVHWFGKPHQNFSELVGKILKKNKIACDKSTWFFDDNIENVTAMARHLGISGAWVRDTGIGWNIPIADAISNFGQPDVIVDRFGYDPPTP